MLTVPEIVVWISAVRLTEPPDARAGTVQVTEAGPVAGVGVQLTIVPENPVKVVVAGIASVIVVAGAGSNPSLVTVIP
jgi:hypothetical protein